ncbi:MAG: DUF6476 family protein [Allgaiera sp.]|nr:DUF6476 family protein [Allgaiera sp.]
MPAALKLPPGARAEAITQGKGWIAVVTQAGKILVFDGTTGKLRHSYDVN